METAGDMVFLLNDSQTPRYPDGSPPCRPYRGDDMNRFKRCAIVLVAISLSAVGRAEQGKDAPPFRFSVDLVDGSRIVGVPSIESVSVRTVYAKMDIALHHIARIEIADDRKTAALALQNGDRIKGILDLPSIGMETVFGEVSIAIEHARVISVRLKTGDARYGTNTTVRTEAYEALYDSQGRIPRYTKHEIFGNGKCYTELLRRAKTTLIQPIDNPKIRVKHVHSGTHEYPTTERVRNNWVSVWIRAGGLTRAVRIAEFNLMFADGQRSLNDAIAGGYIEPLVIVDSAGDQYAWRDPTVIADGTSPTGIRSFPTMQVTFKVKNRAEFTGVKFNSNQDFAKTHDGMRIYKFPSDYGISLHRTDEDNAKDGKAEKGKAEAGKEVF
jgi:hypothetical protein